MRSAQRRPCPGHLDDSRRETRWLDRRVVLARIGPQEHIGVTHDVSRGGMQVGLVGASPGLEDEVEVTVAFEDELLEMRGRIIHARTQSWGGLFGIRLEEASPEVGGYLEARYPVST